MEAPIGPVFVVIVDHRDSTFYYQMWASEEDYDQGKDPVRTKVGREIGGAFSFMLADYARSLPMFEGVQPDG